MTSLARLDEDLLALIAEFGPEAEAELARRFDECTIVETAALLADWRYWATPKQVPPDGRWLSWGFLGGRGMGKTWSISRFVNEKVAAGHARLVGLAAQDEANCIAVQIEGENGLIATAPRDNKPIYRQSSQELIWPNGATASVRTPEVPGKIRGPEYDLFWACEIQSWPTATREEAWDNIEFATRVGDAQIVWDCTPKKNHPILKQLIAQAEEDPTNHRIVRGTTYENARNLANGYIAKIERKYKGTKRGKEELLGEMLDGDDGVTVPAEVLKRCQVDTVGSVVRSAVTVDPSYSANRSSDTCGIVLGSLNDAGLVVIRANHTAKIHASAWPEIVIDIYLEFRCDCVPIETNRGGDMPTQNLRAAATLRGIGVVVLGKKDTPPPHNPKVIYVREYFGRGEKSRRAEPTGTAYEAGRVFHLRDGVGIKSLENTLSTWEPSPSAESPGDLDATVYTCTELLGLATEDTDHKSGFVGLAEANAAIAKTSSREPGLVSGTTRTPIVAPPASLVAYYRRRGGGPKI